MADDDGGGGSAWDRGVDAGYRGDGGGDGAYAGADAGDARSAAAADGNDDDATLGCCHCPYWSLCGQHLLQWCWSMWSRWRFAAIDIASML